MSKSASIQIGSGIRSGTEWFGQVQSKLAEQARGERI